jgi:signal transduction histidine kinase/DNA-binding response OmpR family regulator
LNPRLGAFLAHPGEVEELRRDLEEARDQQSAASEVLSALGRSKSDLEPVFETVVQHAIRLCRADTGQIFILDGGAYRLAFELGGSAGHRDLLARTPIEPGIGTVVGKVALQRQMIHIPDVRADRDYDWQEAVRVGGQRTMLGVPMVGEGEVIGVISLGRAEVNPFTPRQIDLVTTFAAQGVIAIQNGSLFRQLETNTEELAHTVEELEALNAVGDAVSSTLDLQEVLRTIVMYAVELSETDGGSIFEFEDDTKEFHVSTAYGTSDELLDALRATRISLGETIVGQAVVDRQPKHVPDLETGPSDPHTERLLEHGWRSMLAVPLLRENRILGVLVVRRKTPGEFSSETADLLETFASQSALAIQNAQLFREIAEKSDQVEVASRHKSEFLASMSHELRTPLNAVIGFSDVLLEGLFGDLNAKQREYLQDIRGSGQHLLELLNEILDLSKIEAGRTELEPTSFSLAQALEHGLVMVRDRAAQHRIELHLDAEPELGSIVADELKVKQVILNLLTNAVKFTPEGGRVAVKARRLNGDFLVTVHDTGVGIPERDQARIFESFQQGGRLAKEEGTGLGLTLSRRIVELHGGKLWVESETGKGSTFSFTIPVLQDSVDALRMVSRESIAEGEGPTHDGGNTILIVEDDKSSADLLSLHLTGAGFSVEVARDGLRGLELARQLRPAGIVLDIKLPKLDGWDLLSSVKATPELADVPVIIVSMLDERGKGFALGAADYLVKPVAREQVLAALERCVTVADERRKVLVIDDDPRAVEFIGAVLEHEGYTVVRAPGGAEGVAMARSVGPSLVLLDLLMPELDGFEVVERLRADPETADIPIVILTAKTMTAADKRRLNGQISYLARKGEFDRTALVDLVGRFSRAPSPS